MKNQSDITQNIRVCRWCCGPVSSNENFCSEKCHFLFDNWIKSEYASKAGIKPKYWNHIRRAILDRDGHKCQLCGNTQDLTIHHILPISEGGDSTDKNLIVLCKKCHQKAHGKVGYEKNKKKTFKIRIRYKPTYVPALLACAWLWDNDNKRMIGSERNNNDLLS